MVSLIACIARNGAIGKDNELLYHLAADMKRFVSLTTGHTIVMGHNTYRSLPHGALPHRRNVVVTHADISIEGCEVCHSIKEALHLPRTNEETSEASKDEEIFIIGGASVYQQALPYADKIYLTLVDDIPPEADSFFPQLNMEDWTILSSKTQQEDGVFYRFIDYLRKE